MSGFVFLETSELSVGEAEGEILVPVVRTGDLSGIPARLTLKPSRRFAPAGTRYRPFCVATDTISPPRNRCCGRARRLAPALVSFDAEPLHP